MIADLAAAALRRLPPETAHDLALWAIGRGLAGTAGFAPSPRLATQVLGRRFAHPLGLAAGFDKSAKCPDRLVDLGFAFVEVGAVTPRAQPGNPKPRLFRLAQDRALINRFGFNNDGADVIAPRLAARDKARAPLGVNLGANKDSADKAADFAAVYAVVAPHTDFVTVNVSSPNTAGLRDLQSRASLAEIFERLAAAAPGDGAPPILIKLSPDMGDEDFADVLGFGAGHGRVAGFVLTNTTLARPGHLTSSHAEEAGGLSGSPLKERSCEILRAARRRLQGAKALIGVGGIENADDACARLRAGADLVQIYSAFALQGPRVVPQIVAGLGARLAADGVDHVAEIVGVDA